MEEFPEGYFDTLPILIPEVIDVVEDPEPELTARRRKRNKTKTRESTTM